MARGATNNLVGPTIVGGNHTKLFLGYAIAYFALGFIPKNMINNLNSSVSWSDATLLAGGLVWARYDIFTC